MSSKDARVGAEVVTRVKSLNQAVRERAELAGLSLDDAGVTAICKKLESDPLCGLDDLLRGIRNLQGLSAQMSLQMFNQTVLNSARNE